MPGEYNVSVTFNVSTLSLFDIGDDLWMNLSKKRGNDGDHKAGFRATKLQGLIERAL